MTKPKLLIGGRQTGKSTKAREWLEKNTMLGGSGLMFCRDQGDAKRNLGEFLNELEVRKTRWSSVEVVAEDGRRFMFRPPSANSRGLHLDAMVSDPLIPEAMGSIHATKKFLATIDSTEWDVEVLDS